MKQICFCSFPHKHRGARGKPEPQHDTRESSKTSISCETSFNFDEFSKEAENLLPQNQCFVRGFRQLSAHLTKCHACHAICTSSPLRTALPMRFAESTQHSTSEMLRLPRKMKMDTSKVLHLPQKINACSKNVAKVLRLPRKTILDTSPNTSTCHKVPLVPRQMKLRNT